MQLRLYSTSTLRALIYIFTSVAFLASNTYAQILMSNGSSTTCSDDFFDSGGILANYNSSENFVYTICPAALGNVTQVAFNSFFLETNFDFLNIYDGNSTAAPLIGSFTGATNPGTIAATLLNGGCLTFEFTSDASVTDLGWDADISCIVPGGGGGGGTNMSNGSSTTCSDNFFDSGGSAGNYSSSENLTYTYCSATAGDVIQINFSSFFLENNFDFLNIYDGNSTAAPLIGSFTGSTNPGTIAATLANGGCLTFQFTSDGSVTDLGWEAVISCITPGGGGGGGTNMTNGSSTTCNDNFFDSGGSTTNYGLNENFVYTYCPATAGDVTQVSFSSFSTETGFDFLNIYDGNSTAAPLLGSFSGIANPGTIAATLANGACLTFEFISDGSVSDLGWEAVISCTTPNGGGGGGCSDCSNATIIGSLPFNTSTTSCGACNNFSSSDACASLYMGGEDYVFEYTPAVAEILDITLSGSLTWTGLFVTAGCPTTGICVGSSTNSAGNPALNGVSLLAGQTYYIVVSTFPLPDCTPFTININTVLPSCFDGLQNGGETGVDCGGPCPPCSGAATAGDCNVAVNICTNNSFSVDPSGFGLVDELSGNLTSNPTINPNTSPGNMGCLLSGELNSTWMIINIASSGSLGFELGAPGPADCYDWIMWSYDANSCSAIMNNQLPPISCNWNGTCNSFTGMASTVPVGGFANNFENTLNVSCGEQYLICFSNYSSALTTVPFSFTGTATVSCSFFNPITVNNPVICEGSCATLTASGGNSYAWNSSPDLSATNTAAVNACPPNAGIFNYPVTGVGACGTGTVISTVTVLASTDILCNPLLQLPIIEFQAFMNTAKEVDILWRTENEENTDYFVVERSADGVHFESLEEVDATGESNSMILYTSKDKNPLIGLSYYRLKLFYSDGKFAYSDLIAIDNHRQANHLRMFPNPASEALILEANFLEIENIKLINNWGQLMVLNAEKISRGKCRLNLQNLNPGMYTIHVQIEGIPLVRKLIIY